MIIFETVDVQLQRLQSKIQTRVTFLDRTDATLVYIFCYDVEEVLLLVLKFFIIDFIDQQSNNSEAFSFQRMLAGDQFESSDLELVQTIPISPPVFV